jgi:arylsulfatase A-like enzyme
MRTPNIDGLAARGLRFTHFHNGARCCPSRASLLTGLYAQQAGVGDMMNDAGLPGYRGDLNESCVTLAEVLKGAGYGTYACGKWHVTRFIHAQSLEEKHNLPRQRGLDRFFGTINGACSSFEPQTLTLDNDSAEDLVGEGFYYTNALGDHAVRFIGEHMDRDPDTPFFLYAAFTAPHWPLHAPEEDLSRTRGRFDMGWDELRRARYERQKVSGIVDPQWLLTERDPRVPAWEEAGDKDWQLRRMEVYAAQVEILDRNIGRIVSELERRGALDDTLILFLSDNGGCAEEINTPGWYDYILRGGEGVSRERTLDGKPIHVGNDPSVMPGAYDTYQSYGIPWANVSNTPFRLYKSFDHEGGVATPLIVHWPARISATGDLRHQVGHLIDIMPTLAGVAEAAYPTTFGERTITPMEGVSLVPAFSDATLEREAIYFEHEGRRAVLTGEWKLVARGRNAPWELYDMKVDRTETHDLAGERPEEVERLNGLWQAWAERAQVLPRPGGGGG